MINHPNRKITRAEGRRMALDVGFDPSLHGMRWAPDVATAEDYEHGKTAGADHIHQNYLRAPAYLPQQTARDREYSRAVIDTVSTDALWPMMQAVIAALPPGIKVSSLDRSGRVCLYLDFQMGGTKVATAEKILALGGYQPGRHDPQSWLEDVEAQPGYIG